MLGVMRSGKTFGEKEKNMTKDEMMKEMDSILKNKVIFHAQAENILFLSGIFRNNTSSHF